MIIIIMIMKNNDVWKMNNKMIMKWNNNEIIIMKIMNNEIMKNNNENIMK